MSRKKKDGVLEDELEDEIEDPKDGVTIDLDEDADDDDDDEVSVDVDDDDDEDDDEGDEKYHNKINAQKRIIEKLKKENAQLQKKETPPATPAPQPMRPVSATPQPKEAKEDGESNPRNWSKEKWDKFASDDWQAAVDLRTKLVMEDGMEQHTQQQRASEIMEKNKKLVADKHPEVLDGSSEKTRVLLQILQENPAYLNDPKGPIHAMRDMEERMGIGGVAPTPRNTERASRAQLTSTKGRSTEQPSRSVTLTPDEVSFCKLNDIDMKKFAANKARLSKNEEGVYV